MKKIPRNDAEDDQRRRQPVRRLHGGLRRAIGVGSFDAWRRSSVEISGAAAGRGGSGG